MYQFSLKWKAKCPKHPRYRPHVQGESGIVGGCRACTMLAELALHVKRAEETMRNFARENPEARPAPKGAVC